MYCKAPDSPPLISGMQLIQRKLFFLGKKLADVPAPLVNSLDDEVCCRSLLSWLFATLPMTCHLQFIHSLVFSIITPSHFADQLWLWMYSIYESRKVLVFFLQTKKKTRRRRQWWQRRRRGRLATKNRQTKTKDGCSLSFFLLPCFPLLRLTSVRQRQPTLVLRGNLFKSRE